MIYSIAAISPGRKGADHWAAGLTEAEARNALCRIANPHNSTLLRIDPYALLRYAPSSITCEDGTRIDIGVETDA